jgi:hypothetical protein
MANKEVITKMGLDVSGIRKGLKDIKTDLSELATLFSKGFEVKINARQMTNLRKLWQTEFKQLGDTMSSSMDTAASKVTASIEKLESRLLGIAETGKRVGRQTGKNLADSIGQGLSTAVRDIDDKLDAQIRNTIHRLNTRIQQLRNPQALGRTFDKLGISVSEDHLVTDAARTVKGQEVMVPFLNPDRVGTIDRIISKFEQLEKQNLVADQAEQKRIANVEKRHAQAVQMQQKEAADVEKAHDKANKMLEQEAQAKQKTAIQVEKSHDQANKLIDRESEAEQQQVAIVERKHAQANAMIDSERAQVEKAHAQANAMRDKEIADLEKKHAQAMAMLDAEKAQVEKKHAEALAMLQREEVEVEKAHARANAMVADERAEVEKKHAQANAMRERETADVEKKHAQAMRMLEQEAEAQQKVQQRAATAFATLEGMRARLPGSAVVPSGPSAPSDLISAGKFDTTAYTKARQELLNAAQNARLLDAEQKKAERSAAGLLTSHRGMGAALGNAVLLAAKYLIMFRLLHEIARGVETAISGFVRAGLQYQESAELQKLALSASLAEHMKILAVQKEGNKEHLVELTGVTAVNALQATAERQWRQLQQSSLAVVGSTQDLMDLYVGIIPQASRLGATIEDTQKMVKSTAVAASLLKIPFQDARTAIVALLQGRNLTRNRLAGALGLDTAEVERLKGTPALFERIQRALRSYELVAGSSTQTFGALKETFQELMGIVGSQVTSPFVDLFKKGVFSLQNSLFDSDFKPTKGADLFFASIRASMREISEEIGDFGTQLSVNGQQKILTFIVGVREAVGFIKDFVLALLNAGMAVLQFAANNQTLIKHVTYLAAALAAGSWLANFGKTILSVTFGTKALQTAISSLALRITPLLEVLTQTGFKANVAGKAVYGLGGALAGIVTGGLIAGALYGLGLLIAKYYELEEAAKASAEAITKASAGDIIGASVSEHKALASEDPTERGQALLRTYGLGSNVVQEQLKDTLGSATFKEVYEGYIQRERQLSEEVQKGTGLTDDRARAIGNQTGIINRHKAELTGMIDKLREASAMEAAFTATADALDAEASKAEADHNALMKLGAPDVGPEAGGYNPDDVAAKRALAAQLRHHRAVLSQGGQIADANQRAIDEANGLLLKSKPVPPDETGKSRQFRSAAEDLLDQQNAIFDSLAKRTQAFHDAQIIGQQEFIEKMNNIDDGRFSVQMTLYDAEEKEWDEHLKILKQRGMKDEDIADLDQDFRRGMRTKRLKAGLDRQGNLDARTADARKQSISFVDLFFNSNTEAEAQLDQVFGRASEKVGDNMHKLAEKIREQFRDVGMSEVGEQIAGRIERAIPEAELLKKAHDAAAAYGRTVESLQRQQQALDAAFQNGSVSVSEYTQKTRENRLAQAAALRGKLDNLRTELATAEANKQSAEALDALSAEIDAVEQQLQHLTDMTERARVAYESLFQTFQSVQSLSSIFEGFTRSVNKSVDALTGAAVGSGIFDNLAQHITGTVSALTTAVGVGGQMKDMLTSIRQTSATMQQAGGIGSFFSQFSGGFGGKDIHNPFTGQGTEGGATKASAAIGAIGFGVGAAISIAGALFQRSVEKVKKTLTDSLKDISKNLASGAITVGQAQEQLNKARADAIAKYSHSKAGRAALKDILPDLDQQLNDLQTKAAEIKKNFEDKLKDSRLGSGPFGDFARSLIEMEKNAKEFLDSIDQTTQKGKDAYIQAFKDIDELFRNTIREAKRQFQDQLLGFNEEAIDAAIQVFDLMDQQQQLYDSLGDLEERRADLDKQQAELTDQEKKDWADIMKQREENTKHVLDLEKKIADVVHKAAQDEADIRRRGVLEAQETIAQQKAREISQVRHDAQEELDDLNAQLKDAEAASVDDQIDQFNKKHADNVKSIDKERKSVDKQISQTKQQIQLNRVRLDTARQIAAVEGQVFDISGDRLTLEQKRGQIEIQQAKGKIEQWKQVQALIDSIIEKGDDVIFNPPPGFPQIHVKIGDIVINAPGTNPGPPPPPPPPGPPGPHVPVPPGPHRPIPRLPSPLSFTDFERQFGSA